MPKQEKQPELKDETVDLATFMQTLLDAGMPVESALSYGFEWAGSISLGRDKYDHAARELLAASDYLKISKRYQDKGA